jgi:hypothetical protein
MPAYKLELLGYWEATETNTVQAIFYTRLNKLVLVGIGVSFVQ